MALGRCFVVLVVVKDAVLVIGVMVLDRSAVMRVEGVVLGRGVVV